MNLLKFPANVPDYAELSINIYGDNNDLCSSKYENGRLQKWVIRLTHFTIKIPEFITLPGKVIMYTTEEYLVLNRCEFWNIFDHFH
jgi:hypothetical protein